VITTSVWSRRRLTELYPLPADRVHVAEPGVDAAGLAPGSAAGHALLCVAAVTPDKGHDVLLDGLATATDLPWDCACVGSLDRDPAFADGVRRFIDAGEQARFVEKLPLKLVIIDEAIVMFGMEDPVAGPSELTIMVIEHPELARLLKIAFEAVWSQGLTLDQLGSPGKPRRAKTA